MTSRAAQRTVRCNSRPLGLQEEANAGKVTAHLPDQPLAAMVAGPHTVGTACGFGRGHLCCRGQTRRGGEYPARLRRGCGGIAAAHRLDRWDEPLARRSVRDWRPYGIGGRNNYLVYHRLDWSEIESVEPWLIPGYRYLQVNAVGKRRAFWLPLFLTDMPGLRSAVARYAPPGNPLRHYLEKHPA